jgi:hypothetical protein
MVSYYSERLSFVVGDCGWRDEYTQVTLLVDSRPVASVLSERYKSLEPFDAYVKAIRQMQVSKL